MKNFKLIYIFAALFLVIGQGCEEALKEEIYSELEPESFLNTVEGVEGVLFAAYGEANLSGHDGKSIMNLEDWSTDIEWETGGGENRTAVLMFDFTWDASTAWIVNRMWTRTYRAIRNANTVIDNLGENLPEAQRKQFLAEARFIRALSYYRLYTWFGNPVLRTSITDPLEMPKATDQEIKSFIEDEFLAVINDLPEPGQEEFYGLANKGAARGFLVKFYLNSKQWQKCADMANDLIGMNYYQLFPDYTQMFRVENQENTEFIWAAVNVVENVGLQYINGAFPSNYASLVDGSAVWTSSMRNWAAQYRIRDSFYDTFEEGDKRRDLIITEFIDNKGDTVQLRDNADNARSFKYWPDPAALANNHGNDHPEIRYADILLSRAEALNELNGPVQEAIDLINQVRTRAGLGDLQTTDFGSKDELRDHLLKERGWEFYNERIRRQDLIRHNRYYQSAQERGVTNAQAHHVVFPIPQIELDANTLCEQTSGYY